MSVLMDPVKLAIDDITTALRDAGHTSDADEIEIYATTGEDDLAITAGVEAMVSHDLPVHLEDAELAYELAEQDGYSNQYVAARRALADARKRSS